jgi:hypothetical protein
MSIIWSNFQGGHTEILADILRSEQPRRRLPGELIVSCPHHGSYLSACYLCKTAYGIHRGYLPDPLERTAWPEP